MSEAPHDVMSVLLVVDDPGTVAQLQAVLKPAGHRLLVASGVEHAEQLLGSRDVDVVIVDHVLNGSEGTLFAERMKALPETSALPVVSIGPFETLERRMSALEAGADDFLPRDVTSKALLARLRSLVRVKRLVDDLERTESVITSLARAVEAKDGYTEAHTERVADDAVKLAAVVGVTSPTPQALRMGGMLHDVGKIGIPDYILNKPGNLTRDEWTVMKQHPVIGAKICQPLRRSRELVPIVRHHHERLDGSGYPDGLRGEDICLGAQIMSITDFFDACTSDRPYRQAMSAAQAFELLQELALTGQMDGELVRSFIDIVKRGLPVTQADSRPR